MPDFVLPSSTATANGGGFMSQMGGLGNLFQGVGAGINFGSALGTLMNGKDTKRAIQSTIKAGQADAAAAMLAGEMQGNLYLENAYNANFDATIVGAMAKGEAERTRREGRALVGQQKAAAAAQGVQIDQPVLNIIQEQLVDIETVAVRQIHAGDLQKRSLEQQRDDFLLSAQAARREGRSTHDAILAQTKLDVYKLKLQRRNEVIQAFGTMLNSVAQGASMFSGLKSIDSSPSITPNSKQYSEPIGPPAPAPGTAPLIEPQEYMDYAPSLKVPLVEPQEYQQYGRR